nr:hypothetical protein [Gammaproteobacteria bacterium]
MKIAIIGAGYVGLVSGACLAMPIMRVAKSRIDISGASLPMLY